MGRKPTPTTLFDDGERADNAYKKHAEAAALGRGGVMADRHPARLRG